MANQTDAENSAHAETFQYEQDGYVVHMILTSSGYAHLSASCSCLRAGNVVTNEIRATSGPGKWSTMHGQTSFENAEQAIKWAITTTIKKARQHDEHYDAQVIAFDDAKEVLIAMSGNERAYDCEE